MNAFTEDDLDHFNALAQDDNVQGLPGCSYPNRDFLVVHTVANGVCLSEGLGVIAFPLERCDGAWRGFLGQTEATRAR